MIAQSRTSRAIGPAWSSELAKATMPQREQRPEVGLIPEMPVKAAGWRIEPPVSVPVAAGHSRAAIAVDDQPDEPPSASAARSFRFAPPSVRRQGEIPLPNQQISFDHHISTWPRFHFTRIPHPSPTKFLRT